MPRRIFSSTDLVNLSEASADTGEQKDSTQVEMKQSSHECQRLEVTVCLHLEANWRLYAIHAVRLGPVTLAGRETNVDIMWSQPAAAQSKA